MKKKPKKYHFSSVNADDQNEERTTYGVKLKKSGLPNNNESGHNVLPGY
jgi:hypothetical protein